MDNKKNLFIGGLFFCVLAILAGCAGYRAVPLNRLTVPISSPKKHEYISFSYNVFTSMDCKRYLDRDVIKAGYQPVHITLNNNTGRYIFFSPTGVSLPCASIQQVAEQVHTSTISRATGYGLLGLLFWPFLIPAIVDGIKSSEANKSLDVDFESKSLKEQIVGPYTMINGLIFVPIEYFNHNFTIAVTDIELNKKIELTTLIQKVVFKTVE